MDCTTWRECASDYIDKSLPSKLAAEAEAHVTSCDTCSATLADLRYIHNALAELPLPETPLFFAENILSTIEAQQRAAKTPWWRAASLGITTGLAGAAVASFVWVQVNPVTDPSNAIRAGVNLQQRPARGLAPAIKPALITTWALRADTNDPTYDLGIMLDAKSGGTANCVVSGDTHQYRFTLAPGVVNHLNIPIAMTREDNVLAVKTIWNTASTWHKRFEFRPTVNHPAVKTTLSFGVRDLPIVDAAREIAARYNRIVIVEDVPADIRIRINPIQESAEEVLTRTLVGTGCMLEVTNGTLYIHSK